MSFQEEIGKAIDAIQRAKKHAETNHMASECDRLKQELIDLWHEA